MKPETADNLRQLVRRNYEDIAVDFDASRNRPWPEMARLAEEVKPGERVLDAACGNGRLYQSLGGKGIEYLGVDSSQALLDLAKKSFPAASFQHLDILDIDKNFGQFDHMFCLAALQHIPSHSLRLEALKRLSARLKPGGRLILSHWQLRKIPKYRRLIFRQNLRKLILGGGLDFNDIIFPWKGPSGASPRYYHAFTKRGLRRLVREADLIPVASYRDQRNYWQILKIK